eukprot:GILK01003965.1.p1 GENE.GILK01003965.1~~GILK01003965.1.p1  ORF type:complete len:508 (+),score=76.45 GILK01003965.1:50-1573(+)
MSKAPSPASESSLLHPDVRQYLSTHQLEEKVNMFINRVLRERPGDPWQILSLEFGRLASVTPVVEAVFAREILASDGLPTFEVEVKIRKGDQVWVAARVIAPSDSLRGLQDGLELRDEDSTRFQGKGVTKAVHNINTILGPLIKGHAVTDLAALDELLRQQDVTEKKSVMGVNSLSCLSMALAEAGANARGLHTWQYFSDIFNGPSSSLCMNIPIPYVVVLRGGKNIGSKLKFSELRIVSKRNPLRLVHVMSVYQTLGRLLEAKYAANGKVQFADGSYMPPVDKIEDALNFVNEAIKQSGLQPGADVEIGLDCAATDLFLAEKNAYELVDGKATNVDDLITAYVKLVDTFPALRFFEDPVHFADITGLSKFKERLGSRVQIIGEAAYGGSCRRYTEAVRTGWNASCVSMKLDQVGTITDVMEAARTVLSEADHKVFLSDVTKENINGGLIDLAVAIGAEYVKLGPPSSAERLSKYNRLVTISQELADAGRLGDVANDLLILAPPHRQ